MARHTPTAVMESQTVLATVSAERSMMWMRSRVMGVPQVSRAVLNDKQMKRNQQPHFRLRLRAGFQREGLRRHASMELRWSLPVSNRFRHRVIVWWCISVRACAGE